MSPGYQRLLQLLQIAFTVFGLSKEMEYCSVVPDTVTGRQIDFQQILFQPVDLGGTRPETFLRAGESAVGDIEYADVLPAETQQMIHKSGTTTANIDTGGVMGLVCGIKQRQRGFRAGLEPTGAFFAVVLVHPFPVLFAALIHRLISSSLR